MPAASSSPCYLAPARFLWGIDRKALETSKGSGFPKPPTPSPGPLLRATYPLQKTMWPLGLAYLAEAPQVPFITAGWEGRWEGTGGAPPALAQGWAREGC